VNLFVEESGIETLDVSANESPRVKALKGPAPVLCCGRKCHYVRLQPGITSQKTWKGRSHGAVKGDKGAKKREAL
ncbi:MAG: hypothetical protein ABSH25_21360, partial [Syntrophorhabdales bacterium]